MSIEDRTDLSSLEEKLEKGRGAQLQRGNSRGGGPNRAGRGKTPRKKTREKEISSH